MKYITNHFLCDNNMMMLPMQESADIGIDVVDGMLFLVAVHVDLN